MTGRTRTGRFDLCNDFSFAGGRARARKLTPERRKAIAAMGFAALAEKHFAGDRLAAKTWLVARGTLAGLFGREYARRERPLHHEEA